MHRLQEMIRLHRLGRSTRGMARQLRMGRDTIRLYAAAFAKAGVLEGSPDDLPDGEALHQIVSGLAEPTTPKETASSIDRWRSAIETKMKQGAGPTAIHDYLRVHDTDYDGSLSAVKRLVARIRGAQGPQATDVAIPVVTAPGEVAQVDFGYIGMRFDPSRGVARKAWVFVMTLGFSRLMFAEIVFEQSIDTWLDLHVQAFEYLDGVPRVIVPDNLKAAVIRAAFGVDEDPVINRSYRELARHYGFQIDPAPPHAPEKKGKVERSVLYVKGSHFKTSDEIEIEASRRELRKWLDEVANRRRHGTTGRIPFEIFYEEEHPVLIGLPKARWTKVTWKHATLHRDCHVQIDGAMYSAPWRFLKQKLWVRCTQNSVAIHHEEAHLWTHARVARGQRSTIETHLPDHRRDLRHRSQEHWMTRARRMGEEVESLAATIFSLDDVLLKLRQVQAVVTHLESFPIERAKNTALRALHYGNLEYREIKAILKKGLDLEPLPVTKSRRWAQGSLFARSPDDFSSSNQEPRHGHL
ncbi:MAG: IS21 family transposase [Planctomycetes bacterium]|nr:IS21 family transposase [Planctomycetota bacterium]